MGIFMALAILLGSFLLLLNTQPIYSFLLDVTGVYEDVDLPKEVIDESITHFIHYFRGSLPSLLTEHQGASIFHAQEVFHMLEVKLIFDKILLLFLALLLVLILGLIFIKDRRSIMRYQFFGMLLIFLTLGFFAINFEKTFLIMHNVLFDNEYWTFTSQHYLIRILTFEFFLYFFVMIFTLALSISIALFILSRKGGTRGHGLYRKTKH